MAADRARCDVDAVPAVDPDDQQGQVDQFDFLEQLPRPFVQHIGHRLGPREFGQFLGAIALPGAFMALLAALPFIDKDPERNIFKRPVALIGWIVVMVTILLFTVSAIINREFLD